MYHQTLERQIEGDTSGDYRRLLLALVRGNRSESIAVDPNYALADAHALYNAGVARLGTDENAFIQILTTRSPAQLNMTLQYYRQTYGHDFEKAIKKETSGLFEDALLAVVQCTCYPARFFAEELYLSMKGLGTNDQDLIRVLTTRAEIDMYYIKMEFQSMYRTSLEQMIMSDTSGDYRTFHLTLVGAA
jgi:annexin A7/11